MGSSTAPFFIPTGTDTSFLSPPEALSANKHDLKNRQGTPHRMKANMGETIVTIEQIKEEIRSLRPNERIELYRWIDRRIATEVGSKNCLSRIGADRALEIRRAFPEE